MSNGTVTRRSAESYVSDNASLAALRQGYTDMQARVDNRGFNFIAGYHGTPGNYCHTNDDIFLPWHRAYVYEFEQALRDTNDELAVPWWDWTSSTSRSIGVPEIFGVENDPSGNPNPLLKSRINVTSSRPTVNRDTRRFPGDPAELPIPNAVSSLLDISDFFEFQAQFNFSIHGFIHVWTGGSGQENVGGPRVGGDMASVAFAAYDPIFFSHHANVDRIWYLWQLRYGVTNIPRQILNTVLSPFNLTVADVLDISTLGYEYAIDSITVVSGN